MSSLNLQDSITGSNSKVYRPQFCETVQTNVTDLLDVSRLYFSLNTQELENLEQLSRLN